MFSPSPALAFAAPILAREAAPAPPSAVFGPLYVDVEMKRVFPDSKTFADATPLKSPAAILKDYRPGLSTETLRALVLRDFDVPQTPPAPRRVRSPRAARHPHRGPLAGARARRSRRARGSRLALHYPYVVPGGRFRELYYWDSYFTLLGLVRDGRRDLAQGIVDNFADLITRYGHVPNGTRTYYLSRSQPPVFFLMTGLLGATDPAPGHPPLPAALRAEYRVLDGGRGRCGRARRAGHVVRLADGSILNRYWDALGHAAR